MEDFPYCCLAISGNASPQTPEVLGSPGKADISGSSQQHARFIHVEKHRYTISELYAVMRRNTTAIMSLRPSAYGETWNQHSLGQFISTLFVKGIRGNAI